MALPSSGQDGMDGSNQGISTQHASRGGFGITVKLVDHNMSGKFFGGASLLETGHIGKTYIIDPNGVWVTPGDNIPQHFAHSYPGDALQAFEDIATRLSGAAGKIVLNICRCDNAEANAAIHTPGNDPHLHPPVAMSGFWIEGARFVTCAHFVDIWSMPEAEKEGTVWYQKLREYNQVGRLKAIVSSQRRMARTDPLIGSIPVYLLQIDRESDLAVFQAYSNKSPNAVQPPTGLLKDDIVNMNDCDVSQGAFTIGYYGVDRPIQGITSFDAKVLNAFWPTGNSNRPATYFPLKYAGVMQRRDDNVRFQDVFEFPDYRTISAGSYGGVLSRQKRSAFVFCQISAWFQSSGGMVGGFALRVNSSGQQQYRPVVMGAFRGDEGPNNVFAGFNAEAIDWLFNGEET